MAPVPRCLPLLLLLFALTSSELSTEPTENNATLKTEDDTDFEKDARDEEFGFLNENSTTNTHRHIAADTEGNLESLIQLSKEPEIHQNPMTVYGELGVNYYTENKKPYINCARRESTSPNATSLTGASTVKCFIDHKKSRERLGCMAVFMYNGTRKDFETDDNPNKNLIITAQDCWQHEEEVVNACAMSNGCVFSNGIRFGEVMFCCCNTHNCNDAVHLRSAFPDVFNVTDERDILRREEQAASSPSDNAHHKPCSLEWYWVVLMVVSGLIMVCVLAVAITAAYKHFFRQPKQKQQVTSNGDALEMNSLLSSSKKPLAMDGGEAVVCETGFKMDITDMECVAQGRFGRVFRGILHAAGADKTVAVKVFPRGNMESFISERDIYLIETIRNHTHPSVLRYIDWDSRGTEHWIVTEFHPMGNLHDWLKSPRNSLTVSQMLRLLTSLLEGVAFLHEERMIDQVYKPTVVHRDIKSRNVLLRMDEKNPHQLSACIADFGLAMRCDAEKALDSTQLGQVGTRRYMSPEVLEGATEFTAAAFRQIDVYAVALVIWEVMSRTKTRPDDVLDPYLMPYEKEIGSVPTLGDLRELVVIHKKRPIFRPALAEHTATETLCRTTEEMWDVEADGRITAGCALERLKELSGETSEGYYSEPRIEKEVSSGFGPRRQSEDELNSELEPLERRPPTPPPTPPNQHVMLEMQ